MNRLFLILVLISILFYHGTEDNSTKDSSETSIEAKSTEPIEETRMARAENGIIGEYSSDFILFDSICMEYFNELFVEIEFWPETAQIVECVEFTPINVIDSTNNSQSPGVYMFAIHGNNGIEDKNLNASAYYYNQLDKLFIPLYLEEDSTLRFEEYAVIYLPQRDISFPCGTVVYDTNTFDIGRYGVWELIDNNTHEKLKK